MFLGMVNMAFALLNIAVGCMMVANDKPAFALLNGVVAAANIAAASYSFKNDI